MVLKVSQLTVYPVKSLPGVSVDSVSVSARGLGLDRRWMVIDEHQEMVTQRGEPMLSQIGVSLHEESLALSIGANKWEVPPGW